MVSQFMRFSYLSEEHENKLFAMQDGCPSEQWTLQVANCDWLREIFLHEKTLLEGPKVRGIVFSFAQANKSCELDPLFIQVLCIEAGKYLGELLVQNEQGDTAVVVYDRDRSFSMHKGARYHQTREGGSLHTDNVNIPTPWDYLLFTCLAPAQVGGESILVDGREIEKVLAQQFPEAKRILELPFIWEMRGVADKMYEAPILTYAQNGEPLYRYLRPYMTAAHQKSDRPLSVEQLYALDVLDALLESEKFQFRYEMKKGDMLITKDAQVFHGRTCFSDALNAIDLPTYTNKPEGVLKRTMVRLWIRK